MTNQIKAPKKPFPVAGVFLILYGIFEILKNLISLISYLVSVIPYLYEAFNPADLAGSVLSYGIPIAIGITAIVLGAVLMAKRSGVAVTVFAAIYTVGFCLLFLIRVFSNSVSLIHNIDIFISYTAIDALIRSFSNISYIGELSSIAFALILVTVIAFVSQRPEKCESFVVKCWFIPLIFFVFAFFNNGATALFDIIASFIGRYPVSYFVNILLYSTCGVLQFLAHLFLVIWFARLSSYRRKLAAHEASMPIETTAEEVSTPVLDEAPAEVPAPVEKPAPVEEPAPEPELSLRAQGELLRLQQLHETGALTVEQFEALKKQLK